MQMHKIMILGAILSMAVLPVPNPSAAQPTTVVPPAPLSQARSSDQRHEIKLALGCPAANRPGYLSGGERRSCQTSRWLTTGSPSSAASPSRWPGRLINSALKEKGSTTVLIGKTLKVVTLTNAKKENIPVLTGRDPEAIVPSDDVVSYVIPVSHVTATALKQNLEALRPEYASIEANEDGNALIVTDTLANIKRLMQIVVALDTHMATVAEIRVFRLVSADATSAATLINNIFQQQSQGSSRSSQQRGGRGGPQGPLEMMMEMRDQNRNASQRGTTINVQVVAAADERTNSVVVRGSAEALDLVADMIKALDDTSARVADVRVFQLRYADATNAADVINQLFGAQQSSSRSSRSGRGGDFGGPTMFRGPFGGGPGGTQQGTGNAGGSTMQVSAAADSRTNTVVVTGPESVLEIVADVIKKLDAPLADMADVKVFHLEYADAQDTSELINEVFGQSRTSSSSRSSRSGSQQNQQVTFMRGGPFGGQGQATTQTAGGASNVEVIASADSRTNSVVVSGPATTLEVIAQIIKQLDENPEQERRIFVYALKNANATNLMTILNNLFSEMQALNQQTTGRTGAQFQGGQRSGAAQAAAAPAGSTAVATSTSNSDDISEETYCQADPNTNSLLVMTSTKNYQKIKPIIEELDRPVGQVLIKILFAELTHSDSIDWGTEFSMLNLRIHRRFPRTVQVFGRPLDVDDAGICHEPAGPGVEGPTGLSIRTLEGDLDFTIHALHETGRLNVLSRPYVLTRNNQMATITVVEEVPIPESEIIQSQGGSTTTFTYRNDIGIVLEVTPSVNPEGLVNMTVSPKITTRTGERYRSRKDSRPPSLPRVRPARGWRCWTADHCHRWPHRGSNERDRPEGPTVGISPLPASSSGGPSKRTARRNC
jgi:type II secretory pathway component GspD/PulD (secretin)